MNTKLIIIGIIGLGVVLYLIKKLSPGETNVVSQLVPVGSIDNNSGVDSRVAYEASKTSAFNSLLNLGATQQQAEVAMKNIDTSVALEGIRGTTAVALSKTDSDTALGISKLENDTQRNLGLFGYHATLAGFDRDVSLGELQSKTALQLNKDQSDTQLNLQKDYLQAALEQLGLEQSYKQKLTEYQTSQLNQVAQNFRNQSLERQGTILNSLNSLYTGNAPYSYQSSFGGTRPPTFMQQLSGLIQAGADAAGKLIPLF